MPDMAAARTTDRLLSRLAGCGSIAAGVLLGTVIAWKPLAAESSLAAPLALSLVIAGVTDAILGIGLLRGRRAAWAFSLSLNLVLAFSAFLAVPAIVRAGAHPLMAVAPCLVAAGLVVALAIGHREF